MKSNRQLTIALSLALIVIGIAGLASGLLATLFHFRIWRLWPLAVIGVGLAVVLVPLANPARRSLALLLVPGLPILTTGGLLLFASVFRWWRLWAVLWPLEVLSVAAGFGLAALRMRRVWPAVPTVIIGANGAVLQFCALTGWWGAWAVLWTIEPLALGIALLIANTRRHSRGLLTAGLVLCAFSAAALAGGLALTSLSLVRPLWWLWRWTAPVTVILVGVALLVWGLVRPHSEATTPSADLAPAHE